MIITDIDQMDCLFDYIDVGLQVAFDLCPILEDWYNERDFLVAKKWIYRYMGCGNHLLVSKKGEKQFLERTASFEAHVDYYINWMEIAQDIIAILKTMNRQSIVEICKRTIMQIFSKCHL